MPEQPPRRRPRVLVATTNFPLVRRGDRTGNFIVDPVVALAGDVDQVVLMPNDEAVGAPREEFVDDVPVVRFTYWRPRSAQRLAHGDGIPTNLQRSWIARLQLVPFLACFARWLWRLARDADLIHAHWLPVALLALPARWRWGTPIVVTVHGTDITQFPSWFVRWGLRQVDVVVSSHDDLLDEVAALAPGTRRLRIRHLVEPKPVDPVRLRGEEDRFGGGPVALFVARLSPERDPLTFVRAAPTVLQQVPDAHLAVVGDGPLREAVEAEVARLGLRDHVHVLGYRHDVWTYLTQADAFAALSDRNNAWVTAMVEAMRAGVPVVATRSGTTEDALTDERDALLVDVGDPEAVGGALARLLTEPSLGKELAEAARRTLRREGFDPSRVRGELLDLYRDVAARGRPR